MVRWSIALRIASLAIVALSGCTSERRVTEQPIVDGGVFGDGGAARCAASVEALKVPKGAEVRAVWAGEHHLLAWFVELPEPKPWGKDYRLMVGRLGLDGRVLAEPFEGPSGAEVDPASLQLSYDPRGGRVAMAYLTVGGSQPNCEVALLDRVGRQIERFVLNDMHYGPALYEAMSCRAVPVGGQVAGLFAQRPAGKAGDGRLYLEWLASRQVKRPRHDLGSVSMVDLAAVRLQSIGVAAALAFPDGAGRVTVALAEPGQVPTPLSGLERLSPSEVTLARAGEQLLVGHGGALRLVRADASTTRLPVPLKGRLLGATRDGARWLVLRASSGLAIDAYDGAWTLLGQERWSSLTQGAQLLAGSGAAAIWRPTTPDRIEPLICGGPSPCDSYLAPDAIPAGATSTPIVTPCAAGEACHAVLRINYLSGRVLGYQLSRGKPTPIDSAQAEAKARAYLQKKLKSVSGPPAVQRVAGDQRLEVYQAAAGDFGGFCAISRLTGEVVAAGAVVWAGQGSWWYPERWLRDAACHASPAPSLSQAPSSELYPCGGLGPSPPDGALPTTLEDAWATMRHSNVARAFADAQSSALTFAYAPAVGRCDPNLAEILIFLSQSP
jgi:hypothetical protein